MKVNLRESIGLSRLEAGRFVLVDEAIKSLSSELLLADRVYSVTPAVR